MWIERYDTKNGEKLIPTDLPWTEEQIQYFKKQLRIAQKVYGKVGNQMVYRESLKQ